MKTRIGLILAAMISCGVVAQVPTNTPAPGSPVTASRTLEAPDLSTNTPAADASTNKPAAKRAATKKKKIAKKPAGTNAVPAVAKAPAPLALNEPALVKEKNVVVRAKADINSEIVTHLKQGETVTILEEVTRKPKPDEPSKWAKIALPENVHVWVNATFLDANQTVVPAKLNVRSGPGENYGVLGLLHKGEVIKEISAKGDWREIAKPAGAYAFVAAHLLGPKEMPAAEPVVTTEATPTNVAVSAPPPIVSTAATNSAQPIPNTPGATNQPTISRAVIGAPMPVVETPAPAPTTAVESPKTTVPPATDIITNPPPIPTPVAATPTLPPTPAPSTPVAASPAPVVTPEPVPAPVVPAPVIPAPLPPKDETPSKRIVHREGIVRGTVSIQAPAHYQLESVDNGKVIDYLYSTSTNIAFKRLRGRTIIVTGEEGLDERWPNTPVITVDKLQIVK